MGFRNSQADKPRPAVAEKSNGPQIALVRETDVELVRSQQSDVTKNTDVSEQKDVSLETSFRQLWTDYNVDWKDTRRYPGDGAAAPHRKLCMFVIIFCCV